MLFCMSVTGFPASATLAANARVQARIAAGHDVVHMAFGEAGLPVHPLLRAALGEAAGLNGYTPVAGIPRLRRAVAEYFDRRRLPTDPDTVITGPGSKPLLYALMLALPGDLILPAPSWVSYQSQGLLAGKAVTRVPVPLEAGGVPDPDLLEDAIAAARRRGERPGVMVLTLPDNPTGTVPSRELLERVCAVARAEGMAVISDEVYRDLAYLPDSLVSPAEIYPEGTIITGGLSKSLSLGGWRAGFMRLPQDARGEETAVTVTNLASEIWSSMAAPVQAVAAVALDEPPEIQEFVAAGRRLHARVSGALHGLLLEAGATCRAPEGAFYLYPELRALGFAHSADLADHLLENFDIAVLPGSAFGDQPERLRFRLSTSLLYGSTEERRWEALGDEDPAGLPWVSNALDRVRLALQTLRAGRDA